MAEANSVMQRRFTLLIDGIDGAGQGVLPAHPALHRLKQPAAMRYSGCNGQCAPVERCFPAVRCGEVDASQATTVFRHWAQALQEWITASKFTRHKRS